MLPQVRVPPLGANPASKSLPIHIGYFRFFRPPIFLARRFHGAYNRIVG